MDDIIHINLLKYCFDFQRALIGIQTVFKEKNVKNYLLFSELDLRNRWTKLEFNQFRKNNDDTFYYLKKEDLWLRNRGIYEEMPRDMSYIELKEFLNRHKENEED